MGEAAKNKEAASKDFTFQKTKLPFLCLVVKNKSCMATKKAFTTARSVRSRAQRAGTQRFVLIGGFLGAGKTTAIGALVRWLQAQGMTPGVITNDQGDGLIDTALGQSHTAQVREVTGGCFCCRAADLGIALRSMTEGGAGGSTSGVHKSRAVAVRGGAADQIVLGQGVDDQGGTADRPDVFIAEPVGSCTDLVATVILPIEKIYGNPLELAPMSVVIDAARVEAAMKDERANNPGGERSGFTADVRYIFAKQLEEAELLVLNKSDLLTGKRLVKLIAWLQAKYPGKRVLTVSSTTGAGLDTWFALLLEEQSQPKALMDIDYGRYGAGEERMGWYNASLGLHSTGRALDGNRVLMALAKDIQAELEAAGAEIAHFKMSLGRRTEGSSNYKGLAAAQNRGDARLEDFAVVNVVRNGVAATLSRRSADKFIAAELLVNLRAEAGPEVLELAVAKHLNKTRKAWHTIWKHCAAFKPGQPQPTYRVTSLLNKTRSETPPLKKH